MNSHYRNTIIEPQFHPGASYLADSENSEGGQEADAEAGS